ncbi:MAG: 1,4-dihydroxy-2-naphthoate polyprenyltransferase [Clostridia bacterium]|jgi:1,4-dihydroxy-2-naphthoate octaprenyltransferase|nr:1,4-dihydroxy-2-naphthoate polyprenyltransferase [Clostridia bacterium]
MTLKVFLQFVEIQTKLASMIPFLLGTLYASYRYDSFLPLNFLLMFVSLFSFDMATTAINNYIDLTKAHQPAGYNFERGRTLVQHGLTETAGKVIIFTLLTLATAAGIILVLRTELVVLFVGMASFGFGVFYTFGPLPISRMPLGEIFSGLLMGFVIMFLSIYIHLGEQSPVLLNVALPWISLAFDLGEIIVIFLLSIPAVSGIANIMLANNICDVEEDVANRRYTLPYYIGQKKAVLLFSVLYYIAYLDIILLVALGVIPLLSLLTLLTVFPVMQNIKKFNSEPKKDKTFVLSIKNFTLMNVTQILVLAIILLITRMGSL